MYFDRDVNCIKRFFLRRFNFESTRPGPFFRDAKKMVGRDGARRLDAAVEASGFTKRMLKDLEAAIRKQQADRPEGGEEGYSSPSDEDDEEDEDEEDGLEDEKDEGNGANDGSDVNTQEESTSGHAGTSQASIDLSKLSIKDGT
jgi:RIO kinase 2